MSVATVAAGQARYWAEAGPEKAQGGPFSVGYSQPARYTVFKHSDEKGWLTANAAADCSSLVCGALNYGLHAVCGVPWGHPALLEIDAFWTGNLRAGMEARGLEEVPWADSDLYPAGGFRTGDVLLSSKPEGGVGHVVIITDAAGGILSEAWEDSQGSDGWDDPDEPVGDQTGGETRSVDYASHPYTQRGVWTSCHRFNPAKFAQQWSEFASTTPAPEPQPAPAAPSSSALTHGVDVSSHQAGISFSATPADFVIVKVSEDDFYVNPSLNDQAASAVDNGRRLGLYHFARPGDAVAQADYFLDNAGGWVSEATLWLDFEDNALPQGPGWALTWLERVKVRAGKTPGIYLNGNGLNNSDWSSVAAQYPLWYADGRYYSDRHDGYAPPDNPALPYWGTCLCHQYTDMGYLPGWGGNLDLNRWNGTAAQWDAMAGTPAATPTDTDEEDNMKILGLDFGDGTYGYARLTPGLGAHSMTQPTADAFYRAGYRTVWVSGEDFNTLVKDSWAQYNVLFGGLAGKKDIEAATAAVLEAVKAAATTEKPEPQGGVL